MRIAFALLLILLSTVPVIGFGAIALLVFLAFNGFFD